MNAVFVPLAGVELLRHGPNEVVVLRVHRPGRPRDVKLELRSRPKQADAGVLP